MTVNAQARVLDLLEWVKSSGLWPERFSASDRFVVPVANHITNYANLLPHQRRIALWLPSSKSLAKILEDRGMNNLEVSKLEGLFFAHVETGKGDMSGVGLGQTEALLSLLNHLRNNQPVLSC